MKALQHLEKALRRYGARLILRDGEIVLNIPERVDLIGTLEGYAVEYSAPKRVAESPISDGTIFATPGHRGSPRPESIRSS